MGSQLDDLAAADFEQGMREVQQTIIRRIGGRDDRTEEVQANIDFDEALAVRIAKERGGMQDGRHGQYMDDAAYVDLPADQEYSVHDEWVIDGAVYKQHGEAAGKDGGVHTIVVIKRKGIRARQARVTGS